VKFGVTYTTGVYGVDTPPAGWTAWWSRPAGSAWPSSAPSSRPSPPGLRSTDQPRRSPMVRHGMIGIMTSGELGFGPAEGASRWSARVTSPRVLILAAAALVLTGIPLTRYGNGGHPDYFWSSLGVLLAVWQLWDHRRLAWAALTAATTATLLLYGLSIAGVISTGLPGWWIPITAAAGFLALAILLSPPIRRWVTKQAVPAP
jgi:hypothetical protein